EILQKSRHGKLRRNRCFPAQNQSSTLFLNPKPVDIQVDRQRSPQLCLVGLTDKNREIGVDPFSRHSAYSKPMVSRTSQFPPRLRLHRYLLTYQLGPILSKFFGRSFFL